MLNTVLRDVRNWQPSIKNSQIVIYLNKASFCGQSQEAAYVDFLPGVDICGVIKVGVVCSVDTSTEPAKKVTGKADLGTDLWKTVSDFNQ